MSRISNALRRVIREAAMWHLRLKAGDLSEEQRHAYRQWMQVPLHQDEMGRMCLVDALLQRSMLMTSDPPSRQDHVPDNVPDNVIDFESYAPMTRPRFNEPPTPERKPRITARLIAGAAAAGLLLAIVLVERAVHPVPEDESIVTQRGAWDKKLMDDGSVLYAGPGSELTFHSDDQQRTVQFTHGEAFFDVASDPTRPFIVTTSLGTVRVLGTEFLVANRGNTIVVTVREGKVQVSPRRGGDSLQPTTTLVANQQAVMSPTGMRGPLVVDAEREVKWVRNWYEPHGEMVCDVIDELNQRHDVTVVVDDPQVCRMRISSLSFRPSEPEDFVEKVNQIYAGYPHRNGEVGGSVLRLQRR